MILPKPDGQKSYEWYEGKIQAGMLDKANKEIAELQDKNNFFRREIDMLRAKVSDVLGLEVWLRQNGYNDLVRAAKVAMRMEGNYVPPEE